MGETRKLAAILVAGCCRSSQPAHGMDEDRTLARLRGTPVAI